MKKADLRTRILGALIEVAPEIDTEKLDPEVSFRDQYPLDSVDFLNFVFKLEQGLRVNIPQADYPQLSSLQGCLRYFSRHQP